MLRAILFDFDGTIADTEPLHCEAFAEVLGRRRVALSREAYEDRYLGLGTDREALRQAALDFGREDLLGEVETMLGEKIAAMARQIEAGVPLCPGAREFLAEASTVGPLAVVSGAIRAEIEAILRREELGSFFAAIVAAEDVARGKPDPQGYRLGLEALRRSLEDLRAAECLAVEDSPNGIRAARAAGMRTLALTHSRPRGLLREADRVVAGYEEVDWEELRMVFLKKR